jgi:heme-degrading monooxygenase HmoA
VVYELRSYDIAPDKIDEYLNWANTRALPILVGQFGFRLVGFWRVVPRTGEELSATNVHWMIAWLSEDEMNEKWAAARASEQYQAVMKEASDNSGNLVYHLRRQSTLLKGVHRSPLQ